jgi:Tfp pilus assembly protein PilV
MTSKSTKINSDQQRRTMERSVSSAFEGQGGFSLLEACCALVIILIALLGVSFAFTYAINYNAGNASRSQALAVLQQEVEQLRAAKFTPTVTDTVLTGGTKPDRNVVNPDGKTFTVQVAVDNDPFTDLVQNDAAVPNPTLKEIKVTAKLAAPSPGWQTAIPATIILRRVRAN